MKTRLTYLAILLLLLSACSKDESTTTTSPSIAWKKGFDDSDNISIANRKNVLEKTSNNGFLLAIDGYVMEYDSQGNSINEFHFTGSIYELQASKDGGYILYGKGDGDNYNWFVKTDAAFGNPIEYTFLTPISNSIAFIEEVTDGFIVGSRGYSSDNYDSWITKMDNDGNQVWQYVFEKELDEEVRGIEITDNGDLLVLSSQSREQDIYENVWITKLSGDGNLIWEQTFLEKDYGETPYEICQRLEGGYLVMTTYLPATIIYQIDDNGEIIDENEIDADYIVLKETNDGNFILTGTFLYRTLSPMAENYSYGSTAKINSNGEIIWEMYDSEFCYNCDGISIVETSDGGYVTLSVDVYDGFFLSKINPE